MTKVILSIKYGNRSETQEFLMKNPVEDWKIADEAWVRALDFAHQISILAAYEGLPYGGGNPTPADYNELLSSLDYEWSIEEVDE